MAIYVFISRHDAVWQKVLCNVATSIFMTANPGFPGAHAKRTRLIPAVNIIGRSIKAGCKRPLVENILRHLSGLLSFYLWEPYASRCRLPAVLSARTNSTEDSFCASTRKMMLKCSSWKWAAEGKRKIKRGGNHWAAELFHFPWANM